VLALLSSRYANLFWGAVAIAVAILLRRLLTLIVGHLANRRPVEERQLARLRRGETLIVLIATAVPYATAIVVVIVVASAFLPKTATALGGSALVGVLIGFAAQRFLMDVVAGALIALEHWYGVGDFVTLEPAKASGIVEEFGLRSTVVRALNGDRAYVPNSQIIAATRSPRGYRTYSIELLTSDPEEAKRAIGAILTPPARRGGSGERRRGVARPRPGGRRSDHGVAGGASARGALEVPDPRGRIAVRADRLHPRRGRALAVRAPPPDALTPLASRDQRKA
jgi:hypothetical protein